MEEAKEDKTFLDKLTRFTPRKQEKHFHSSLYTDLKSLKLPADPTQRMNYLLNERDLLIQILADYHLEHKVLSALTVETAARIGQSEGKARGEVSDSRGC